ncbi:hypothetical protein VAE151_630627 [Vibrio aestuarianus]|uniref:Uncharacterized protein n=1 Tax=Vibrio aestuarianus TaxID=28171 RepID=A0ABM9FIW7_9VIBR|nr:hypothetical protein VAE063_1010101 [Vibrio aestuarianus]CAH8225778.1 hypothetical protein VIBAE_B10711 [Vibrio aestuarianus subsp. francensis]CAH8207707.1 hypothetical protein VAEU17_3180069 [Vibrio aestuarianus]CAH8222804.1 hypothetical protein VAE308_1250049 [Vibrio aestuarianus]CAH8227514.1 hypothetical protein VAE032_330101 [Vibrio aestuarianus]
MNMICAYEQLKLLTVNLLLKMMNYLLHALFYVLSVMLISICLSLWRFVLFIRMGDKIKIMS